MPPAVLLSLRDVAKSFGGRPVFSGLDVTLAEGEHVGLVGPNGAGKSTLLQVLAGTLEPDGGERVARRGLRVALVPQDAAFTPGLTVEEVVLQALAAGPPVGDGERERRLAEALGSAGFADRGERTDDLSGGWRKRLAIARELALLPDLLLLDEPTNHLDLEGIVWLEELLRSSRAAFVAVSHDRLFLERTARRMLDLDRRYPEGVLAVDGGYADFLEARDERLRNDAAYRETLANLVRREVEWLRRGPKARTTKAKSRVADAHALVAELEEAKQRAATATAGVDFTASGRRSKRLWKGEGLVKGFGERTVLAGLDLELVAGTRLGILGRNGSGKTTLLRLIAGELEPDAGTIRRAEWLQVVYFDQHREALDPTATLAQALAPHGDQVSYQGRSLHVAAWAARFLFRPEQLRSPLGRLSGGERARVAIARLMLRPADLLVLDEPTNDLDIPTLDALEESLLEHQGAIVLVTHDRLLLDRVCDRVLALDGRGGAEDYAGVEQWLAARAAESAARERPPVAPRPSSSPVPARASARKLNWREQQEWDGMEGELLAAEERLERAEAAVADPAVATDATALQARVAAAAEARAEVERLYARWVELEAKATEPRR